MCGLRVTLRHGAGWHLKISPPTEAVVLHQSAFTRCCHSNAVYLEKPNLIYLCCDPLQASGNKVIPSYYLGMVSLLPTNASHVSERSSHLLTHPVTLWKPDMGQIWQQLT